MKRVVIHLDGSCPVPMGPGGWAAIVQWVDEVSNVVLGEAEVTGYEVETTNQRMELQAAVEALLVLRRPCRVLVVSDSKYLVDGMTRRWFERWLVNGWRNAQRKPVLNRDLWELLIAADGMHEIEWRWVKGHSGVVLNERADVLAGEQTEVARAVVVEESIGDLVEELEAGMDLALGADG